MKRINIIFMWSFVVTLFTSCQFNENQDNHFKLSAKNIPLSNDSTEKYIDDLYKKMTLNERLSQLQCMYMADLFDKDNRLDTALCRRIIPYGIGHIPQYAGNSVEKPEVLRDMVMQLQQWLIQNTPQGIPALFHEEVLSGFCGLGSTIYPQQIGQACSFNTELAVEKTKQTAKAMKQTGGALALSPMVDVIRNPYFNRLEESYGEDSYLSAAFGVAFAQGLQQEGFQQGILTCSKHFLGYGGGSESDLKELYEEILLPHEAMIRICGNKVVMPGYHQVHGTYSTINRELMQEILRDYLHFDGICVTDYGAMSKPGIGESPLQRAALAINAGIDVEFQNRENYSLLPEAIKKGLVSDSVFEQAVKRVLRIKAAVGLIGQDPKVFSNKDLVFDTEVERKTAYKIASQSIVLLKNNGILPLNDSKKIALVGPNANTMWAMLGDYTYPSMNLYWRFIDMGNYGHQVTTLKEGMERLLTDDSILEYSCGCDWNEVVENTTFDGGDERARWLNPNRKVKRDEKIDESKALEIASRSDVVVAAVGENVLLCGESRDRGSLRLPGNQEKFVRKLIDTGKPVILVIFGGRAQVIGDLAKKCAAIIQAWYPGEEGGNAVADIIFGKINPSAKLCVGYPKVELNENICYNYSETMDSRLEWPFGYGMSYTKYQYSNFKVDNSIKTSDNKFFISLDVTNIGEREGEEIVQFYLSPTNQKQQLKPIKLVGFGRVNLKPGETKTLRLMMSPQQLGYWADKKWHITSGKYLLKAGASSIDIRAQEEITMIGDEIIIPLRTIYFSEVVSCK